MRKDVDFVAPFLLYFCVALVSIGLSVYRPFHNWDMIMYIAAAKSFEEKDVVALHNFTYDQLKESVSKSEFDALTKGDYRYTVFQDPQAFAEQLPFYQIRPVYILMVYLLYKMGLPIAFSTHFISGIAVGSAILVLFTLSRSYLSFFLSLMLPFLAIIFGIFDLAKYSTPDGLAFLAYIFAVYLLIRKRILSLFVLLPFIVGIRTDLFIFSILLYACSWILFREMRKWCILSLMVSIGVYIAIISHWNNPGWATTFYFTLVHVLSYPISVPPVLRPTDYLYVLAKGAVKAGTDKTFLLYLLISLVFIYYHTMVRKEDGDRHQSIQSFKFVDLLYPVSLVGAISIVYVGVHFLLFPVVWTRFFTAPYLMTSFAVLHSIRNACSTNASI